MKAKFKNTFYETLKSTVKTLERKMSMAHLRVILIKRKTNYFRKTIRAINSLFIAPDYITSKGWVEFS